LIKEHREMVLLLIKYKVEFILIGGYTVIYYGYGRTTDDMDIWLKSYSVNKEKFLQVMTELGINDERLKNFTKQTLQNLQFFYW
jgi:hypothetical protein